MTRFAFLLPTLFVSTTAMAFDPGSDETDGDLDLTGETGEVLFDPDDLSIDSDGDNVFHFIDVVIPSGVTLRMRDDLTPGPVYWLVSGDVDIDGTVDLSGEDGAATTDPTARARPGPGGTAGGLQSRSSYLGQPVTPHWRGIGNSAGAYMGRYLYPLVGGVGSSGSSAAQGDGGGGALLIAFGGTMTLDGTVDATGGGTAGNGALRFVGPKITGTGTIERGGRLSLRCQRPSGAMSTSSSRNAGEVVVRFETDDYQYSGTTSGGYTCDYNPTGTDFNVLHRGPFIAPLLDTTPLLPPGGTASKPTLTIDTIAATSVTQPSSGAWSSPDVSITASGASTVVVDSAHIPVSTTLSIRAECPDGYSDSETSTGLTGTLASGTDNVDLYVPPGYCQIIATAGDW